MGGGGDGGPPSDLGGGDGGDGDGNIPRLPRDRRRNGAGNSSESEVPHRKKGKKEGDTISLQKLPTSASIGLGSKR